MRYSDLAYALLKIWEMVEENKDSIPSGVYTEITRECSIGLLKLYETYKQHETRSE